jgi:hypothetical protein
MCRLKVNGEYVLPNEKFEVKKEVADDLIRRGRAKDEKSVPSGAKAVEPTSGPTIKKAAAKPGAKTGPDDKAGEGED